MLATLAVHELGHLVSALVQGFRFELFVVGPLGVKREEGKIKVYLNKNVGYMGGIASAVPVEDSRSNRRKFAVSIISGPLASLTLALVSYMLYVNADAGLFRALWFILSVGNAAIFVATTVPTKSGVFFTDRARFQRLMSKGKTGEIEEALLTLVALSVRDGDCRNLPLDKVKLLQEDRDKMMRFWGLYYEYCYFRDNQQEPETAEAKAVVIAAKHDVPASVWKALKVEQAER